MTYQAREATTIFYVPTADPQKTVTVTETVTPTQGVKTVINGRPWTTANPHVVTISQYGDKEVVVKTYPPQPQFYQWQTRCRYTGKLVGAFFGGFGLGLLICMIVMFIMIRKCRKLKRQLAVGGDEAILSEGVSPRPSRSQPTQTLNSLGTTVVGGERPWVGSAVVASIREIGSAKGARNGKGPIHLPGQEDERQPLLAESAADERHAS